VALARHARQVAGLDPDGLKLGAQVIVIPHGDLGKARAWARPMVASLARFKVLDPAAPSPRDDTPVLGRLREEYDMTRHAAVDKMPDGSYGSSRSGSTIFTPSASSSTPTRRKPHDTSSCPR
jgi:hypothetical protein